MLLFHAILATLATVSAQSVEGDGCLRLLGSVACPGCTSFSLLSVSVEAGNADAQFRSPTYPLETSPTLFPSLRMLPMSDHSMPLPLVTSPTLSNGKLRNSRLNLDVRMLVKQY